MKNTIRTFIAIKIIPEKKLFDLICDFKKTLAGEEIHWIDIDNLHLTLSFIGETNDFQVTEITKMLETISKQFQPFQFELSGVSVFKNNTKPRVLFVSVEIDQVLMRLANEIRKICKTLGFKTEETTFNPHLTLGRIKFIKNKTDFYALVNKFCDSKLQSVIVSEVVFYQSILSSDGPVYKPIKIVKLY